jgi:FkbH-like protein
VPTLHLISDFNIELLGRQLRSLENDTGFAVHVAEFGQVIQSLRSAEISIARGDVVFVWARPERVISGFAQALAFERVSEDAILAEVDEYASALLAVASQCALVLVPEWTLPLGYRGFGALDGRRGVGAAGHLQQMRARLAQQVSAATNVLPLTTTSWFQAAGALADAPKMWFAAKVPYGPKVFAEAAEDIRATLSGFRGEARRVIVVDLDDTMWGGVVGETGWRGLQLGGHHHVGEAFVDFQRALKAMSRRGIQLAIASKNDEDVAMEAITSHPEMALRKEDFSAWRISWQDKATSIRELAEELNLGLKSFVFLDDNPSERGRVRELLPDVLVPEWPTDPTRYVQALQAMRCFDVTTISEEDEARTRMYAQERERRAAATNLGGPDAWLASLGVVIEAKRLTSDDLPRATQLLNKTNQLNLATRRLSEGELFAWSSAPGREVWTFRVSDRFGPSGLTGLMSLETIGEELHVVDYLLSCRVMGRKVEESMLHLAWRRAHERQLGSVVAHFTLTDRNAPCLRMWRASGFTEPQDFEFRWSLADPYALPSGVALEIDGHA